ncbi:unnamed protein product [Closterium sp. Naga37s-1]|nr:unnamed protein product [Closterium sp. Naga37s-1]
MRSAPGPQPSRSDPWDLARGRRGAGVRRQEDADETDSLMSANKADGEDSAEDVPKDAGADHSPGGMHKAGKRRRGEKREERGKATGSNCSTDEVRGSGAGRQGRCADADARQRRCAGVARGARGGARMQISCQGSEGRRIRAVLRQLECIVRPSQDKAVRAGGVWRWEEGDRRNGRKRRRTRITKESASSTRQQGGGDRGGRREAGVANVLAEEEEKDEKVRDWAVAEGEEKDEKEEAGVCEFVAADTEGKNEKVREWAVAEGEEKDEKVRAWAVAEGEEKDEKEEAGVCELVAAGTEGKDEKVREWAATEGEGKNEREGTWACVPAAAEAEEKDEQMGAGVSELAAAEVEERDVEAGARPCVPAAAEAEGKSEQEGAVKKGGKKELSSTDMGGSVSAYFLRIPPSQPCLHHPSILPHSFLFLPS